VAERMTPPIPADTERLLIELPSWIGDVVMATPVLRAAREALPKAQIAGLMRPGIDVLLAGCPWIDERIVAQTKGLGGVVRGARAVRRFRPDAAILLPNSFRSALALRLGGAPTRVGYARDGRGFLLTAPLDVERKKGPTPTLDYYVRLAAFAFGRAIHDRAPTLFVSEEERAAADRLLEGVGSPFVVLNPGANKPTKRWPAARFAAAGDALAARQGMSVVVNGSPGERDVVDAVVDGCAAGAVNLVERGVTLGSLKAVIERAALLVTNDTGPRHIAAALGTPTVVLFGPTDHRWTTLPVRTERLLLAEPFLPEELTADDHATLCAVDRIPASDVVAAAESLLSKAEES